MIRPNQSNIGPLKKEEKEKEEKEKCGSLPMAVIAGAVGKRVVREKVSNNYNLLSPAFACNLVV